jgi:septal ring factor EnvC (AmiA/AmiB activator)
VRFPPKAFAAASARLGAGVAVLALAIPAGATADPGDRQDEARQRIERISASLGANRAAAEAARSESARAAGREAEISSLLASGAERAASLEERAAAAEESLERSRKRLKRAERLLADRLVAMYMTGSPDPVDLALKSSDFGDLVTQQEYLVSIQEADERLARRVRSVRDDFRKKSGELELASSRVEAHNAELAAARAGIASARAEAESTAARLAAVNRSRSAEISSLKSDIDRWEKQVEEAEAAPPPEAEEEVERELGGPYSIPTYIVMCESGGNYSALNPSSGAGGAYQIMPETWEAYGGEGLPHEASKAEQDRIAALIYADSGTSPWVCG